MVLTKTRFIVCGLQRLLKGNAQTLRTQNTYMYPILQTIFVNNISVNDGVYKSQTQCFCF